MSRSYEARRSLRKVSPFIMLIPLLLAMIVPFGQARATIDPSSLEMTLLPGHSETLVDVPLEVPMTPEQPEALDLYLLQDESGSFHNDIEQLRILAPEIVEDVRELVPDSQFGIGGFRDFPFRPWGETSDWSYRRVLDMTADETAFIDAVDQLTAYGGHDFPESQYEALYQTASGAGRIYDTYDLPAGQNPNFRAESIKVVVLTTDAPFHQSVEPGELGYDPDYREWSPGMVLFYHILERAFGENIYTLMDLGSLEGRWKSSYSTSSVEGTKVVFVPSSLRNAILVLAHCSVTCFSDFAVKLFDILGIKEKLKGLKHSRQASVKRRVQEIRRN